MSTYRNFSKLILNDYLEVPLVGKEIVIRDAVGPAPTDVITPFDTSPDGTTIPPAPRIVDTAGGVWTLDPSGIVKLGEWQAGNGEGDKIVKSMGQIFVRGVDHLKWWRWNGNGQYVDAGTTPPAGITEDQILDTVDFDWKLLPPGQYVNPKKNVQCWITNVKIPWPIPGASGAGFTWKNVFPEGTPGGRDYSGGNLTLFLESGSHDITVEYFKTVPVNNVMRDVVIGRKTKTVVVPT